MTTPKPRDFGIGDEVLTAHGKPAIVKYAETDVDGDVARVEYLEGGRSWLLIGRLVHASDGAPLGEFVPISAEIVESVVFPDADWGESMFDLDKLNAFLKGETP